MIDPTRPSPPAPPTTRSTGFTPRWGVFAVAVIVLIAGVVQQYVVPVSWIPGGWPGFFLDLFLVYGLGFVAFFVAFGVQPLRRFVARSPLAVKEGLRWYGTWGVLGWGGAVLFLFIIELLEPQRVAYLLSRSTPVVQAGMQDPLFYICFSFAVGAIEETLFRGYLLGTVLMLDGTRRWKFHALWCSLLFAGVHLYYAQTYEEVSPFAYLEIVSLGLTFSFTYVRSGGNLLVIALLHGVYDATSYLSLVPGAQGISEALTYGLLFGSGLFALILYLRENPSASPSPPAPVVAPAISWPPSAVAAVPPPPPQAVPPSPPGVAPPVPAVVVCDRCRRAVLPGPGGWPTSCPSCGQPLGGPAGTCPLAPPPPRPSSMLEVADLRPGAWPP